MWLRPLVSYNKTKNKQTTPTFSSKQFLSIGKEIDWFLEFKTGLSFKGARKSKQRMTHRNSP